MFSNLLQPGFFRRLAQIVFLALLTAIWLISLLGAYDYETQFGSESSSIAALLRYVIAATAVVLAAPFMMRLAFWQDNFFDRSSVDRIRSMGARKVSYSVAVGLLPMIFLATLFALK
jgi:hypothetical protein